MSIFDINRNNKFFALIRRPTKEEAEMELCRILETEAVPPGWDVVLNPSLSQWETHRA